MMHYYAYLDDRDIIQMIISLPSKITASRYILIPVNEQALVGKRYNRQTGEFVDVVILYYADLGEKDIVVDIISSETEVTDPNKILISSNNTNLIGKWYNRSTGEFLDEPIHIMAELDTGQINIKDQEKWLQTEIDEINSNLLELGYGNFGGFKCEFDIKDSQAATASWATAGKDFIFNFDTGIQGYFPKMIRIVNRSSSVDTLAADIYIVKNKDDSVKLSYMDKVYLGIPLDSDSSSEVLCFKHHVNLKDSDALQVGNDYNGKKFDEGAGAFFQAIYPQNAHVSVGNFNYTENSFSFTMQITSNLVGRYTAMDLTGYVF